MPDDLKARYARLVYFCFVFVNLLSFQLALSIGLWLLVLISFLDLIINNAGSSMSRYPIVEIHPFLFSPTTADMAHVGFEQAQSELKSKRGAPDGAGVKSAASPKRSEAIPR